MSAQDPGQIIFVGEFLFPDGDAAAIRTMSLARICRDLGYRVTVVGKGRLRPEDLQQSDGTYVVEGIHYVTMNPRPLSFVERLRNPLRRATLVVETLSCMDLAACRAIVINASDSARHVPLLKMFCERRSIPLVADDSEWYDPRQFAGRWFNPFYAIFSLVFHLVLPRLRNYIVVSKMLENRFRDPRKALIRIAAPFDVLATPCGDTTPRDRIVFLYAGIPGRKDLLAECVLALAALAPSERARVEFRLLGPSREDLERLLGRSAEILGTLGACIQPRGRVARNEVIAALQGAHFSVLLRPKKRYANAGFPSKVAESLATGTPVLLNLTSDLADYLADEAASLVVRNASVAEIAAALRRALQLKPDEFKALRAAARRKAEGHFDYRLSLEAMSRFLGQLS